MNRVHLVIVFLLTTLFSAHALSDDVRQRHAIQTLVGELDYLIEHAQQLEQRYRGDVSSVRFNYQAFIEQAKAMRNRTAAYLQRDVLEIHAAPPARIDHSLTVTR